MAENEWWHRARRRLPMTVALAGVTAVWVFGCVWSFAEQRAYATAKRFGDPALFPLVLDGLAASMAGVAFAASLDGRPAVAARIGTALAVLASAASNGAWAAERSAYDPATIAMGVVMPVAANIAFEVLLGELRRQVQRGRGLPAPVAVPTLRLIRLVLAPWGTFTTWRRTVLDLTALTTVDAAQDGRDEPNDIPEAPWDGRAPDLLPAVIPDDLSVPPPVPLALVSSRPAGWDGLLGRPRPTAARRTTVPGLTDMDTAPIPVVPPSAAASSSVVPAQVSDEDEQDKPTDDDILAALRSRRPVPGIGKVAEEFRIGKTRAGRIKGRLDAAAGTTA